MFGPIIGILYDGFAYGMLLFLLSVGLSVTLGMMNFVNLAHGAFAMLGGFVTVTLMNRLGWPFIATLPAAFVAAAVMSVVLERLLYRRLYRRSDLDQCLLTIGIVFVSIAAAAYLFGTVQQELHVPSWLTGNWTLGAQSFSIYRGFLILVALALTALLVGTLEFTRFGAKVRAAVDNQRMARGLGIDVDLVFALTFALGCGLAGLGGALAIEVVGSEVHLRHHTTTYLAIHQQTDVQTHLSKAGHKPTYEPSDVPTKEPAIEPTQRPTISMLPTISHTFKPSTAHPTRPTRTPSFEPSFAPTVEPTAYQTNPSYEPSTFPTMLPSFAPETG
eukprot:gene26042-28426_t